MKFSVNSATLLKHLAVVNGAVPSNPLIPILDNFLFEVSADTLLVTASDLQTTMSTQLTVSNEGVGSICVPARLLIDTLKALPEQPVTIEADMNSFAITLSAEVGTYKLSGENAIDFPRIPVMSGSDEITVKANVLARAINSTIFATSTDDLRPAMTGVLFQFSENNTTFVSTDGHRLVRYRRMDVVSATDASLIIPKKALTLLKSALPSDDSDVVMSYTVQNAYFTFGNSSLICRLIDERFPDYAAAIPASNPFNMVIPRADFMNSLKRVSLYANKTTHQVRLKISEKEILIQGEDIDFSNEGIDRLACEYDGDALEIGFNAKFLTEMLSNLESNLVEMHLAAPNRQGLLIPRSQDSNEDVLMLVMPVMLNTYV